MSNEVIEPGLRPNRVKRALKRGEAVCATFLSDFRAPAAAMWMARAGFDMFFMDAEHCAFDRPTVAEISRVARLCGISPNVRVPGKTYQMVTQPLDDGAQGIMVPFTETAAEAAEIVRCVKYPPMGVRGCSTGAVHGECGSPHVGEFIRTANEETLVIVQVESVKAVENAEAIAAVPGVDGILVGPNDLSISMGLPNQFDHPRVNEAIERVIVACARAGKVSGLHTGSTDALRRWREKGMQLLSISSDIGMMMAEAARLLKELRRGA